MSIEKITPQIAALYFGQKCDVEWLYTDTIGDAFEKGDIWSDSPILTAHITRIQNEEVKIRPYLRSLSTLTEEECQMLYQIETGQLWTDHYGGEENAPSCIRFWFQDEHKSPIGSPMVWLKMLEMGFDLFGLIPAGIAKEIVV